MAIPKIKATYSLDAETIRLLEKVSRRWGVSKSEALRRAIHASAQVSAGEAGAIGTLDRLQKTAGLSGAGAARWQQTVRTERRASRRQRP